MQQEKGKYSDRIMGSVEGCSYYVCRVSTSELLSVVCLDLGLGNVLKIKLERHIFVSLSPSVAHVQFWKCCACAASHNSYSLYYAQTMTQDKKYIVKLYKNELISSKESLPANSFRLDSTDLFRLS